MSKTKIAIASQNLDWGCNILYLHMLKVNEVNLNKDVDNVEGLAHDEPDPVDDIPPLVVVKELPDGGGVLVAYILIGNR